MLDFPAFRTDEWMREASSRDFKVPSECLNDVELQPEHMQRFPSEHMFAKKASDVKDQMRRALFRQALFKIQNVEVTDGCSSTRTLVSIQSHRPHHLDPLNLMSSAKLIRDELWTVDRCGKTVEYRVSYLKEDADGFSTSVVPKSFADKIRLLRFYYF